jgi:hypothetical protein
MEESTGWNLARLKLYIQIAALLHMKMQQEVHAMQSEIAATSVLFECTWQ